MKEEGDDKYMMFFSGILCYTGAMISVTVQFAASAFKHHYTEADIYHVLLHPVYDEIQDEGDDKHLLIGFDHTMNLVEIVYNVIDEQTYKVFHADKCQKRHLALLKR